MNEKIIDYTSRIRTALEKERKRLSIDKLYFEVEQNEEVKSIRDKIEYKIKNIEELQRFLSFESKEILNLRKEISDLRVQMCNIDCVKKYNKALAKYNEYIDYINKEIFSL